MLKLKIFLVLLVGRTPLSQNVTHSFETKFFKFIAVSQGFRLFSVIMTTNNNVNRPIMSCVIEFWEKV